MLSDYDGNPVDPLMAVRNMAVSQAYNEYRLAESYLGVFMDGDKKPLSGELTIGSAGYWTPAKWGTRGPSAPALTLNTASIPTMRRLAATAF